MARTTLKITPRFYETDALGHINNASLAAWLETSRMDFLGSLGDATGGDGGTWLLVSVKIDFAAETFFGSDVCARITDAQVGNSSLRIEHALWQGERLTVRASSVLVYTDPVTRGSTRIPDAVRSGVREAGFGG